MLNTRVCLSPDHQGEHLPYLAFHNMHEAILVTSRVTRIVSKKNLDTMRFVGHG